MTMKLLRAFFVLAALSSGCKGSSADMVPTGVGGDATSFGGAGGIGMCGTGSSVGGSAGSAPGAPFPPQVGPTVSGAVAPPAISGGTLRVLRDGVTAVAADPDRDRVYVVDLAARALKSTITLQPGDEPGRLVEDGAGRVHVALRRGGALVTIVPGTGALGARRAVCAAPRGVAYDVTTDLLHVACAGGELVSLPADGGAIARTIMLDHDLRDVVVDGPRLRVSRFRSAELLTVEADGSLSRRQTPPGARSQVTRGGQLFSPAVAWRMMETPAPGGGVVMLHQRGVDDEVAPAPGGYGGFDPCNTIVQTAITTVDAGGQVKSGPALAGLVVAVDLAVSPDGARVAIVSAGNATNAEGPAAPARLPRLFVTDMGSATDGTVGCQPDGHHGPCLPLAMGGRSLPPDATGAGTGSAGAAGGAAGATGGAGGSEPRPRGIPDSCGMIDDGTPRDPSLPEVVGTPIAVAFDAAGRVIVQSREPALLQLAGGPPITLSTDSVADTGHALFHANAGGGMACASCHAEGNDDGRVWKIACEGPRRTQSLQTGLVGTEPFHWNGDEKDFPQLISDVFVGRMSGPVLMGDQSAATLKWIDAQPRPPLAPPTDPAAVARGHALYTDTARAGCVACHAGARLTNNQSVDVGTGGMFQVPSLVGIGSRGPYLHDGCAATLRDRFGPCGGGDRHGFTSTLTGPEISDLIAYLDTL